MGTWAPIKKTAFLKLAAEYGANAFLASDLWYFRPVDHSDDTEDQVRGNLELMKLDGWIEANNAKAAAIQRHHYQGTAGGRCSFCNRNKRAAEHNCDFELLNAAVNRPNTDAIE